MHRFVIGTLILSFLVAAVHAVERVPIHFNVPDGLEQFSGVRPVTFGVPFPQGVLSTKGNWRVVDAAGEEASSQFEITATWTAERKFVRWLLVDVSAEIEKGVASPLFLEFGDDVTPSPAQKFDPVSATVGEATLTDGRGVPYRPEVTSSKFEVLGAVRLEEKRTGRYVAADGRSIAEFETRVRQFHGQPFVRVFHTLIWQSGPETELGSLVWKFPTTLSDGKTRIGLDGQSVSAGRLRQTAWNSVVETSTKINGQLDGWATLKNDESQLFAALRWPWHQFPVSLGSRDGQLRLGLLDPVRPMSLKPDALAVDYVIPERAKWNLRVHDDPDGGLWNMVHNGPDAMPHLSPRGVAKTWEFVLWRGDPDIDPGIKNILTQQPVLAYADPAFATRANLPSPTSPRDPRRFPVIEAGLERAFDWITREHAFDGDFGTWNYGDLQWAWVGPRGYTTYRYWMNHGKGWSITPWLLWLRSGDRRYWRHGEANSRHCMDIDICHVPEWRRAKDFKIRGGQYHYSALQLGYGPSVATFYMDSEYLPYHYYLTGYRRAWDVTQMRAEALIRDDFAKRSAHFREHRETRSRHLYIMLKDLAVLYEATWRPELKEQLKTYLDLTLDAQLEDGNFLGVKSNHYLDQPLLLAARVLPKERERIYRALQRWTAHQGDAVALPRGSGGSGPWSMWTRHALARQSGNPAQLAGNLQLARAQAVATADDENEWRGLLSFEAHLAGPILRDWVVAMSGQATGEPTPGFAPILHFNSRLPDDQPDGTAKGRSGRHVALVLKKADQPLDLSLHFFLHNMGTRIQHKLRVISPTGAEIEAGEFYTQHLRQPDDQQDIHFQIPARQPAGVYALILHTVAPVCVRTSIGKIVHYLPEGSRALTPARWSGQAWFMPRENTEVVIGHQPGTPRERVVIIDPRGAIVASSNITGTRQTKTSIGQRELPVGEPATYQPKEMSLHSFIVSSSKWSTLRQLKGMQPWLAARPEQWFDPTQHPMPDLNLALRGKP